MSNKELNEILVLMEALKNSNQLLKVLNSDPLIPADQKQIISRQIDDNITACRIVSESEVSNA